jgi:hypothetical protein
VEGESHVLTRFPLAMDGQEVLWAAMAEVVRCPDGKMPSPEAPGARFLVYAHELNAPPSRIALQ